MRPCFVELALFFLLLALAGCNGSGAGSTAKSETKFDPCEGLRELNPHCGWTPHWYDTGVSTNAIDETKTEHLMLESIDPDGMDYGRLHYAELKICFKNGKLCGGDIVGVGVTVHGMVSPLSYDSHHRTPVRLKFDDERPARETWGISDDKETLFPYGHEKQFLSELITHRKLILEFSYYEKAPTTITFELSGLGAQMKTAGLQDPTPELEATRKAKAEADERERIAEKKYQAKLDAEEAVEQQHLEAEKKLQTEEQIKLTHQRAVFKECLASYPTATVGSPEYKACLKKAQD